MVAASRKALIAVYTDYPTLVKFFREETLSENDDGKKQTAQKILRKLVCHSFVARFAAVIDITHILTKHSCNSQNDVLTILELEHLNNELFDDLKVLANTKIAPVNRFRFGTTLKKHAPELSQGKF